jgi:hypothetical protein
MLSIRAPMSRGTCLASVHLEVSAATIGQVVRSKNGSKAVGMNRVREAYTCRSATPAILGRVCRSRIPLVANRLALLPVAYIFSMLRQAMPDTTEQIRELAYHLWDLCGRPHGADIEHWLEARRILANRANGHSDSADESSATKPGKAKKHKRKAKPEKVDRQKKKKGNPFET